MSQTPEIRQDVNNNDEEKRKKGGVFGRLFGGGSGGPSGLGAAGSAGGGSLAANAGTVMLVLGGTVVAAGVGLLGYHFFGPGEADQAGGNVQLFAPKPKDAPAAATASGPAKDGNSDSLTMLAKSAADEKAAQDKAAAAANPPDAKPAETTSASASNAGGSSGGGSNAVVPQTHLKAGMKMGELSHFGGGGGGAATAGGSAGAAKSAGAEAFGSAGAKGSLSGGMKNGTKIAASGMSARASGRRGAGTIGQAIGVRSDNAHATSSFAAGRTYDNAAASQGGTIGGDPGAISLGGTGDGSGAASKTTANPAAPHNNLPAPPPTPSSANVTPWQKAISEAQGLAVAAMLLLMLAKMVAKMGPTGAMAAKIIGYVVAAMGVAIIALGVQISGGQYGQKMQGLLLGVAGAGLVVMGLQVGMATDDQLQHGGNAIQGPTQDGSSLGYDHSGPFSGTGDGMTDALSPMMKLAGVAVLAGMMGSMLKPPQSYPADQFKNGPPPQGGF